MRNLTIILVLALYAPSALGSAQGIICGWQPGEIYIVGFHPSYWGYAGFYYSSDYGESIELRDSIVTENEFGALLADAEENTIHRLFNLPYGDHLLSRDGGFSWELVNYELANCGTYATGVIPGEIYRKSIEPIINMEHSINYGVDFSICSTIGFPDTSNIYSAALGSDSGEVYIWTNQGNLYCSCDYAEHFTYLGNLNQSAGIMCYSQLTNGAEQGEVYAFYHDYKKIWRIYDYGANVEVIANFPHGISWYCGISSGREPGEVYFLALNPNFCPGGTMEIWHTTNYGQDWTMYEHYIPYNGIKSEVSIIPADVGLHAWPNPANSSFTIEYDLPIAQRVKLNLFSSMGQLLWQCRPGLQLPGTYQVFFDGSDLSSGIYLARIQAEDFTAVRKIVLVK